MQNEPSILTTSGFGRCQPLGEQVARDVHRARQGRARCVITSSIDSPTGRMFASESEDTLDEPVVTLIVTLLDRPVDDFLHILQRPQLREFCRFWDAVAEQTGSAPDRSGTLITFGQTGPQVEIPKRVPEQQVPPIWQMAAEIGASVPDEEWAKVPRDLSRNVDHYLYGAPKTENGA